MINPTAHQVEKHQTQVSNELEKLDDVASGIDSLVGLLADRFSSVLKGKGGPPQEEEERETELVPLAFKLYNVNKSLNESSRRMNIILDLCEL